MLTAAHCVMDEASYRIVAANRAFRMQAVSVRAIAVHPAFVPGTTPAHPTRRRSCDVEACAAARARVRSLRCLSSAATHPVTTASPSWGSGCQVENRKSSAPGPCAEAELVANRHGRDREFRADRGRSPQAVAEITGAGACHGDSGGPIFTGPPGRQPPFPAS